MEYRSSLLIKGIASPFAFIDDLSILDDKSNELTFEGGGDIEIYCYNCMYALCYFQREEIA